MAIHFIHIGKTGGTAIKFAIRQHAKGHGARLKKKEQRKNPWTSPLGSLYLQGHSFKLSQVPDGDLAIFSVRNPATRFVSAFYSRLLKGEPRHFTEWTDDERKSFQWFSTPQELADALTGRYPTKRKAEFAMNSIRHLRKPMVWWTGDAAKLRLRLPQVLYIARQETLDDDWERLKILLQLPADLELPSDPVQAHRFTGDVDRTLTPKMLDALRDWYAADYRLLEVCDEAREELIPPVERLAARSDATSSYRPLRPMVFR